MSALTGSAVLIGAFLATLVGTGLARNFALQFGLLDTPNSRSSHTAPTPSGGGLAIATTILCLTFFLWIMDVLSTWESLGLLIGGIAVASVGIIDDYRGLSPLIRLVVHTFAALWIIGWLGGTLFQPAQSLTLQLTWREFAICLLAIIWMLNLFNFMDGIDGIAATEAIFIFASGGVLTSVSTNGQAIGVIFLLLGIAAANIGFVIWNWAPAKIFMGDVGSGFIGYLIAFCALIVAIETPVPVWTWIILSGAFIADATVTLLRRVWHGERWYIAHRSHGYQHLARRWQSHSKVSLAYLALNLVVIFPVAYLSVSMPSIAAELAFLTLGLICGLAVWIGAGKPDNTVKRNLR